MTILYPKATKTRTHSPVQDGFPAAVEVVKLLFCYRIVHIHRRHTQLAGFRQLVQPKQMSGLEL